MRDILYETDYTIACENGRAMTAIRLLLAASVTLLHGAEIMHLLCLGTLSTRFCILLSEISLCARSLSVSVRK